MPNCKTATRKKVAEKTEYYQPAKCLTLKTFVLQDIVIVESKTTYCMKKIQYTKCAQKSLDMQFTTRMNFTIYMIMLMSYEFDEIKITKNRFKPKV